MNSLPFTLIAYRDDMDPSEKTVKNATYFDDAIALCGYGKFHIYLFVSMAFAQCAGTVATGTTSYLIANAECDLQMTLADKGILNAITFVGMLSSGLVVGFLCDAFGRRPFLVWGFLIVGLCLAAQAFCQTLTAIVVLNYLEGFFFTAPYAVNVTYIGEMHSDKIRSRIMLYSFCFGGLANCLVAFSGWIILPYDWELTLIENAFVFRSWHLFLLINSAYAIITGILCYFLPESPKFLLAQRKPDEALAILQKIYAMNTGKPAESFPVEHLYLDDKSKPSIGFFELLKNGIKNMKPLFVKKQYIKKLIHVSAIYICMMVSSNVFRMWYPQLSTIFEDYRSTHNETRQMCVMIDDYLDKKEVINTTVDNVCISIKSGPETYIRSSIIGILQIFSVLSSAFIINRINKKYIIFSVMGTCGVLAATLFLVNSSTVIFIYFAIFVPIIQIPINVMLTITVDSFPTAFRTLTVAIQVWIGRVGTVSGNIFFPYLLESGCLVPFMVIACLSFSASLLGLLLPADKNIRSS